MSCLFDSLSKFTNFSSNDLRQHIVSYLQTNPKLMGDDTTFNEMMNWEEIDSNSYINDMSNPHTWGGAIEIKAFTDIFQVNVNVHVPMFQKIIEFKHEPNNDKYVNILWTGNHYIPL
jgi:hypothetical protein